MLGRGTNVKDEEPDPKPETVASCQNCRELERQLAEHLKPGGAGDLIIAQSAVLTDVLLSCPNPRDYSDLARFHKNMTEWYDRRHEKLNQSMFDVTCPNKALRTLDRDVLRDRLDRLDKGLEELAECARRGESQIGPILDVLATFIDEIRNLVGGQP